MEEIPPEELNRLLGHFYCKVMKSDGSKYEPDKLTCFQRSIDKHLSQDLHKSYSIIRDSEFTSSREKLTAARKMLKNEGKGNRPLAAQPIEDSDIEKMWESGTLGDSSPETLLNTIWFLLTIHMGLRGRDEHYKAKFGDFSVHHADDGFKYIEFKEHDTNTRSGEHHDCRAFMSKMWSTPHNMNRCPVRLFEAFASKRPPDMCYPEAPFYLAINYNHTIHGFWYKNQKMGIQRIGVIMKKMASYYCLSGKKTNHSARKTMITALVKNDIPETQIIQLSGHKNLHSLNSYKKASMEQ